MPRPKNTDPQIIEMPSRKMAVVTTAGHPNVVAADAMPALFGSVYTLKFARKKQDASLDFRVGCPCARWPDAHLLPKDQWTAHWGIPIPDDVADLPQKVPGVEMRTERWEYGTVAQVLHLGPYSEEGPTVARLHDFVEQSGYEIAGPHEEEYASRPEAKARRTTIRYQARRRRE